MRYVWEEADVVCGRRVWTSSDAINGECLIGYRYTGSGEQRLVLISLSDGLIAWERNDRETFAEELNTHRYRPLDVRDVPRR